jgi:hypothetical protein
MSTLTAARTSIADVNRFLARCRDTLERGEAIDIAPLEPALQTLAEHVGALPKAEATALKSELIALYDELERFGTQLSDAHAAIGQKLKGLSQGARTAQAYGKPPKKG